MPNPAVGMSRREAIRRASLVLGTAISAPTVAGLLAGLLAGCERQASKPAAGADSAAAFAPRVLSAAQLPLVVAMAEHILPRTNTPGATDARVVEFVDAMLSGYSAPTGRQRFLAGLNAVDARATREFGDPFLGGTTEQQTALVVALDRETFATRDGAARDPAAAQRNPVPGLCIHEMGTARMGRDPKTSVPNAYNQSHDVPNLFVTDGACMTSSSCVNPSLTYMALAARAVDHAVGLMKQRAL